jgi:hypothetical protein
MQLYLVISASRKEIVSSSSASNCAAGWLDLYPLDPALLVLEVDAIVNAFVQPPREVDKDFG